MLACPLVVSVVSVSVLCSANTHLNPKGYIYKYIYILIYIKVLFSIFRPKMCIAENKTDTDTTDTDIAVITSPSKGAFGWYPMAEFSLLSMLRDDCLKSTLSFRQNAGAMR